MEPIESIVNEVTQHFVTSVFTVLFHGIVLTCLSKCLHCVCVDISELQETWENEKRSNTRMTTLPGKFGAMMQTAFSRLEGVISENHVSCDTQLHVSLCSVHCYI